MILGISTEYLVLAMLGVLIHVITSVLYRTDKSKNISVLVFVKDFRNWLRIALSVLSVYAILLMSDDVAKMMHIELPDGSPAHSLLAFLAGVFNYSLVKRLMKLLPKTVQN